ncbi:polymorphic toxin type 50 domain-containing protein [Enterococcus cecorum]|uniref:Polymorphic toxin type 50 domain-containing protein n=1 Tax=Enterococcus cecorum TaxID=44008 RepID=A0AAW8TU78_9ENTE|nr:polymorphic toxin type 50 domain-containing protein [Enterococcus cecorum]MDT2797082.1 polymorphic toxin type 50 domain-containing protein [Enterococcus cecorum]
MNKDIVPDLLEAIQSDFENERLDSKKIKHLLKLLEENSATYLEANDYAVEIGELLSKVLNRHITAEILPDGKMYFNIADRILNETLKNNYELITDYAENVQAQLNKKAEISLKAKRPQINQDRIDSLVNKLVSKDDFEAVRFILKEPIVNFSQSIVDDAIEVNVDFHAKVGMAPKIIRTAVGKACKWCRKLEGIHDYHSLKNEDVFHRHDNCRCTVDYFPGEGKKQNVWTKQERKIAKNSSQRKRHQFEDIKANNHKTDSAEYKKLLEVLGKDNMPVSVAKFQEMKYNETERYEQLLDKMFIQNKFNTGEWLDKINPEKQAKHFQSSAVDGKSYFYDEVDVENLYDKYKQTSKFRRNRKGQNEENYELIDLPDNLKLGKDFYTGEYINGFTIHYSKTGSHIIPTYHRKEDNDET